MSRKKAAKGSAKRPLNLAAIQKVEKELLQMPSTLAAQLSKEIASLKQQENKIKKALMKSTTQLRTAEKRVKTAGTMKHTATGKKQLKMAKKICQALYKTQTVLNKELKETTHALQAITTTQTKLTALQKHINQFGKTWAKQAKKKKTIATRKTTSKKAMPNTLTKSSITPIVEETTFGAFETTGNSVSREEATDVIA